MNENQTQAEGKNLRQTKDESLSDAPTCSDCGAQKSRYYMAGVFINYRCFKCEDKMNKAWNAVKARAIECLSDFEAETSVTVKLAIEDQRQWAFVKTDDDATPVFIWNHLRDDGEWEVREVWLNTEVTNVLREFLSVPNAKGVAAHPKTPDTIKTNQTT